VAYFVLIIAKSKEQCKKTTTKKSKEKI